MAAAEFDWIVCLGEHREVVGGTVSCPLAAARVRTGKCLECRHLSHVPDERMMSLWCATPDVASPRWPVIEASVRDAPQTLAGPSDPAS